MLVIYNRYIYSFKFFNVYQIKLGQLLTHRLTHYLDWVGDQADFHNIYNIYHHFNNKNIMLLS